MAIRETMQGVTFDGLFAGPEVAVLTRNVTLASGQNVKRGALLKIGEGDKYAAVIADGDEATAVATEAVDAAGGDVVTTVYIKGRFNAAQIIVNGKKDAAAAFKHEEQLRKVGIYLAGEK